MLHAGLALLYQLLSSSRLQTSFGLLPTTIVARLLLLSVYSRYHCRLQLGVRRDGHLRCHTSLMRWQPRCPQLALSTCAWLWSIAPSVTCWPCVFSIIWSGFLGDLPAARSGADSIQSVVFWAIACYGVLTMTRSGGEQNVCRQTKPQ